MTSPTSSYKGKTRSDSIRGGFGGVLVPGMIGDWFVERRRPSIPDWPLRTFVTVASLVALLALIVLVVLAATIVLIVTTRTCRRRLGV